MRLKVHHRTHYAYASPVRDSFNEVRLQPTTADGQVCHNFELKIVPAARVREYRDFQLNCVHLFEVAEPHPSLEITATSIVTTTAARRLDPTLVTTPLTAMGACARMERCHDFLQSTRFIDPSVEAWKLGLDITSGLADAWQASVAITAHIYKNFKYVSASTHVHTHTSEVLSTRRGVCQDFAQVMIAICRSLKIPARYVSGYLYNGPADQLLGAQASHAWVEVFLPEHGWRGLDPTNNRQPDENYVKLAHGRDYSDALPVRGTYRGTNQHRLTVDVLVSLLEPVAAASASA